MYCPKCRANNDVDAKFCEKCGTKLVSPTKNSKESSNQNNIYLIIGCTILIAILGVTAGYLILGQETSDSSQAPNSVISQSSGFPVSETPNLASEILKVNGTIASIQYHGVTLDKNQCLYILAKAIVMINSGQTGNIPIKSFGDASESGGVLNSAFITKVEYLDMADRTYTWMDANGRAPNHTGIDFAGSPDLSPELTLKAFAKILTEYKATGKLHENISI